MCAQHSVHPTGGTLRVFKQFARLEASSGKAALSPPAHPQVTHPVGWRLAKQRIFLYINEERESTDAVRVKVKVGF